MNGETVAYFVFIALLCIGATILLGKIPKLPGGGR